MSLCAYVLSIYKSLLEILQRHWMKNYDEGLYTRHSLFHKHFIDSLSSGNLRNPSAIFIFFDYLELDLS